ncbi:SPOR domain-containing protein [Rhodanobacter aciditrophus]|uniref:SPOR domain-containing protein n=1 Tax=Rhodanobacter aciditrophus TaxID=1623218 RepID=A0ABW4B191_9GAMM
MLDTKTKYRLIGAGLLVLSAAVLLPLVLDGERPPELDVQVVVPERPAFPEVAIAPVKSMDDLVVQQQETASAANSQESSPNDIELIPTPKAAAPTQEPLDTRTKTASVAVAPTQEPVKAPAPEPIAERWTLQVATFGKKENATRTLKRLQDAGYPAYIMTTNALYKVFVGPELKRSASDKAKEDVKKEFSLNGIVVKYSPNS